MSSFALRLLPVVLALVVLVEPIPSRAHPLKAPPDADTAEEQLENLTLEQLMDVKVTSASKKEENLSGAPAAIYVITAEDIRRGGFTSLPDVLRVVPGMTIQQVNSHAWTVSTRGFNSFPNEKMLVLIDGRAVYDPLYGGVYWDVQTVRIEDIERIEVIRGPGGALWGVNAVNGIINIISKSARDTQGISMTTSLGHDEGYQGSVRFGDKIGKSAFYRVYARSSFWDPFVTLSGEEMFNGWHLSDGGLRADWSISEKDNLSIDASGYQGRIRDTAMVSTYDFSGVVNDPYEVRGGHILTRWSHKVSPKSNTSLLAYCDWTDRSEIQYGGEFRNTCDLEFQHDYDIKPRHSVIWGSAFRSTADQTRVSFRNHFSPPDQRINFWSAFGQYELQLVPDRVRVVAGSKFEHVSHRGFDVQPQVRAVWTPAKNHNVWGAVSRTVRVPTRNEHDNFLIYSTTPTGPPPAPPIIFLYQGNPDLEPESLKAYELGYRYHYRHFSFDAAAFYNSYNGVIYPDVWNPEAGFNPDPPYLSYIFHFKNLIRAQTHGLEFSAKWRPIQQWQLAVGVTELRGNTVPMYANATHQFSLQSWIDLPRHFAFDSALYHTNAFSIVGVTAVSIPTGNRVDLGLSWRGVRGLSLGVWGRNVQSDQHAEGSGTFLSTGQVRRSVVVKISWDFEREKKP